MVVSRERLHPQTVVYSIDRRTFLAGRHILDTPESAPGMSALIPMPLSDAQKKAGRCELHGAARQRVRHRCHAPHQHRQRVAEPRSDAIDDPAKAGSFDRIRCYWQPA